MVKIENVAESLATTPYFSQLCGNSLVRGPVGRVPHTSYKAYRILCHWMHRYHNNTKHR